MKEKVEYIHEKGRLLTLYETKHPINLQLYFDVSIIGFYITFIITGFQICIYIKQMFNFFQSTWKYKLRKSH